MDENLLALWYWNTALDDDALTKVGQKSRFDAQDNVSLKSSRICSNGKISLETSEVLIESFCLNGPLPEEKDDLSIDPE